MLLSTPKRSFLPARKQINPAEGFKPVGKPWRQQLSANSLETTRRNASTHLPASSLDELRRVEGRPPLGWQSGYWNAANRASRR